MSTGYIGNPSGNTILPLQSFTKQTKWIPLVLTTDITCPQAGFAVTKCLAQFSADSSGQWVVELIAHLTWNSATITSVAITLPNMTMYNGFTQEMRAELIGKSLAIGAAADSNASTITLTCASTATTVGAYLSGKVTLKSEPTTYTTAANLENNVNVAAYFPNASTTAGLLNYYQEDDTTCAANTFSGSAGGAASGVCALKIRRVGSLVSVIVPSPPSVIPTSNSNCLLSSIAVPSWARPVSASYTSISGTNNGVPVTTVLGIMCMQSNGLIYVYRDVTGTAFTNSQNAGWTKQYTLTYIYGV